MKHGIIWFLHINTLFLIARIAIIPLGIIGFVIRIFSPLFPIVWALFGICFIILLLSIALRAPNTRDVKKYIESYDYEFADRQIIEFSQKHQRVNVITLKGYKKGKCSRVLDNRVIYGSLVMLAVVNATDGKWIVKETKALTNDSQRTTNIYRIDNPAQITMEKIPDRDDNARLIIRGGDVVIDVLTHDDYHLTDFISSISS